MAEEECVRRCERLHMVDAYKGMALRLPYGAVCSESDT